jgi:hypothetical protein
VRRVQQVSKVRRELQVRRGNRARLERPVRQASWVQRVPESLVRRASKAPRAKSVQPVQAVALLGLRDKLAQRGKLARPVRRVQQASKGKLALLDQPVSRVRRGRQGLPAVARLVSRERRVRRAQRGSLDLPVSKVRRALPDLLDKSGLQANRVPQVRRVRRVRRDKRASRVRRVRSDRPDSSGRRVPSVAGRRGKLARPGRLGRRVSWDLREPLVQRASREPQVSLGLQVSKERPARPARPVSRDKLESRVRRVNSVLRANSAQRVLLGEVRQDKLGRRAQPVPRDNWDLRAPPGPQGKSVPRASRVPRASLGNLGLLEPASQGLQGNLVRQAKLVRLAQLARPVSKDRRARWGRRDS